MFVAYKYVNLKSSSRTLDYDLILATPVPGKLFSFAGIQLPAPSKRVKPSNVPCVDIRIMEHVGALKLDQAVKGFHLQGGQQNYR